MGVLVMCLVKPRQTVGRPPARPSAYTVYCFSPSHKPRNASSPTDTNATTPPRAALFIYRRLALHIKPMLTLFKVPIYRHISDNSDCADRETGHGAGIYNLGPRHRQKRKHTRLLRHVSNSRGPHPADCCTLCDA